MQIDITESRAKTMARTLRDALARTPAPSYQQALEIVAHQLGYADFGAMKNAISASTQTSAAQTSAAQTSAAQTATAAADADALRALAPFAQAYQRDDEEPDDRLPSHAWESPEAMDVTIGDFKHARDVLESLGRTDLLDHRSAAAPAAGGKTRTVTLSRGDLAEMDVNALCDLASEVDLGKAQIALDGLDRSELEEVWLDCDLLQGRLENPFDVEKNGFAGLHERNTATLLADIALNDQLHRLAPAPANTEPSSAPAGGRNARVHHNLQHPLDDIFWDVELRPAPQGIDSFAAAARTAIGQAPTLCAIHWAIDETGRPEGGWTGHDHAIVELDEEDLDEAAARALADPAVDGSIHAFCHDAGLANGHLWVASDAILWSREEPKEVLQRGGFVTVLVPGANNPSALRSAISKAEDVLINTFLN